MGARVRSLAGADRRPYSIFPHTGLRAIKGHATDDGERASQPLKERARRILSLAINFRSLPASALASNFQLPTSNFRIESVGIKFKSEPSFADYRFGQRRVTPIFHPSRRRGSQLSRRGSEAPTLAARDSSSGTQNKFRLRLVLFARKHYDN